MQSVGQPKLREGFPDQRLTILPHAVLTRLRQGAATRHLYLTRIGSFPQAPGHYVSRSSGLAEHLLILCLAGSGQGSFGETSFRLQLGEGIILPAHLPHHYEASVESPWSILWLHYRGRLAKHYHQDLLPRSASPTFRVAQLETVRDQFELLYSLVLAPISAGVLLDLHVQLANFLVGLARAHQETRQHQVEAAQRVAEVIHFLRANLHRRVSIQEMAAEANWTPNHFNHVFREQVQETPAAFFQRLQMARACERLTMTDLPVAQIGMELGYEDAFYFSRCFRRCYQMNPTSFRRLHV